MPPSWLSWPWRPWQSLVLVTQQLWETSSDKTAQNHSWCCWELATSHHAHHTWHHRWHILTASRDQLLVCLKDQIFGPGSQDSWTSLQLRSPAVPRRRRWAKLPWLASTWDYSMMPWFPQPSVCSPRWFHRWKTSSGRFHPLLWHHGNLTPSISSSKFLGEDCLNSSLWLHCMLQNRSAAFLCMYRM